MTEIEKMPRVNWEAIQAFNPGPDLQEVDAILVAEAQRKADMEWMVKEGFVKLPSEAEIGEFLSKYSEVAQDKFLDVELYRWLKEAK